MEMFLGNNEIWADFDDVTKVKNFKESVRKILKLNESGPFDGENIYNLLYLMSQVEVHLISKIKDYKTVRAPSLSRSVYQTLSKTAQQSAYRISNHWNTITQGEPDDNITSEFLSINDKIWNIGKLTSTGTFDIIDSYKVIPPNINSLQFGYNLIKSIYPNGNINKLNREYKQVKTNLNLHEPKGTK